MSNVPKLRFKDDNGKDYPEWEAKRLKDLGSISSGVGFSETYQGLKGLEVSVFKVSDMNLPGNNKYMINANNTVSLETCKIMKTKPVNGPAIIFAKVGAAIFLERKRISTNLFLVDNNMMYLIPKINTCVEFIYYLLINTRLSKLSQVGALPSYNASDVGIIKVNMPTLPEQTKIADFFTLIDKKITKQDEKVAELEQYKKGLMQKIFSREIRFKDEYGKDYPIWENRRLGDIVYLDLKPTLKPNKPYKRLGVRSHGKGTFSEQVENPDAIGMDTLYEVKANQLIVNITFAWEQAICITQEKDIGMLVSHRFPTYSFNNDVNPIYYKYYTLQPKFYYQLKVASPGGAGRNRVLNKSIFLDIMVPKPNFNEQTQIANFLNLYDRKIEKEKEKLDALREQKKGLLQQMFV